MFVKSGKQSKAYEYDRRERQHDSSPGKHTDGGEKSLLSFFFCVTYTGKTGDANSLLKHIVFSRQLIRAFAYHEICFFKI